MNRIGRAALVAAVAAGGGALAQDRVPGGPEAVYWMSAQTTTGFMGAMGGGGGRPGMGAMMGMMMGGGGMDPNAVSHTLRLQLGSVHRADGEPQAEHDPPEGLNDGSPLPLVTPVQQPSQPVEETPQPPQQYREHPHGRMLIFWGCGEHAGPGQPYVIDFSTMGQNPAAFAGVMRGLAVTPMQPPSPGRYATYGEWPNARSNAQIGPDASLTGDHTVRGNYSPDIHFSLDQSQDFMAPLRLVHNDRTPSGSVDLAWNAVPTALGYFATAMGSGGQDTMVMWTSSATRAAAFALPDYLAPGETRRLVAAGALMPPSQTECVAPEEMVQAMGRGGFVQLVAFGDEANFAWPPRPQRLVWTVKVRYRSSTSAMLGQPGPMGGEQDEDQQRPPPPPPQGPGGFFHGLGGFIP